MGTKPKSDHVFETLDTIRNSAYKGEFVFSFVVGAMILEEVVDLVGCTKQEPVQIRSILFGYEVAH